MNAKSPEAELVSSTLEESLEREPSILARKIESLDLDEAARALSEVPEDKVIQVVQALSPTLASELLQRLPYPNFRFIMDALDSQRAASIFFHFPSHLRELFLLQLEGERREAIQEILTFPVDSAGRLMTKDFLVFTGETFVAAVIENLRKDSHKKCSDSEVYVVDQKEVLLGKVSMRDLLLAEPDAKMREVMSRGIATVSSFQDKNELVQIFSARNESAFPVVDLQNRLLGVVRAQQILDDVQEGGSEDLQKMFGAGGNEQVFSPYRFSLKKRLPWLHVNLLATFMSAIVIGMFEDVIARITVLAVFLPIVSDAGTGTQSMAIVMRGLVMREIAPGKVRKLIAKEFMLGGISGLVIGSVTALIAWAWKGNVFLGLVVGLGMIINLSLAGLIGASVPLVLKKLRLDPAQCSSMISESITCMFGFLVFLALALLFQSHLT